MAVIMGQGLTAMAAANFAAINPALVTISGGTFMMGSTNGDADERPVHRVTVDRFTMGATTTVNTDYGQFVNRLGRNRFVRIGLDPRTGLERVFALGDNEGEIDQLTGEKLLDEVIRNMAVFNGLRVFADIYQAVLASFRTAYIGEHRPPSGFDAPRQPVINVSWSEALAFANLLGLRLPTEAGWEFAARVRPDGGLREYATLNDNVNEAHHQAGSTVDVDDTRYSALPNGLWHMSGNVLEWLQDWYDQYPVGPVTNPIGPLHGQFKILRGGSWFGGPRLLRAAGRVNGHPDDRRGGIGFRVAGSPQDSVG